MDEKSELAIVMLIIPLHTFFGIVIGFIFDLLKGVNDSFPRWLFIALIPTVIIFITEITITIGYGISFPINLIIIPLISFPIHLIIMPLIHFFEFLFRTPFFIKNEWGVLNYGDVFRITLFGFIVFSVIGLIVEFIYRKITNKPLKDMFLIGAGWPLELRYGLVFAILAFFIVSFIPGINFLVYLPVGLSSGFVIILLIIRVIISFLIGIFIGWIIKKIRYHKVDQTPFYNKANQTPPYSR